MRIRPATSADRPHLGRMGAQLVRFHHGLDPDRFMLPGGNLEEVLARWLGNEAAKPGAVMLVAEAENGQAAGYAYGTVEGQDWNALRDRCGMLHDLWVDEASRRGGVARALCLAVLARFGELGVPRVVLSSATGNEQAQRLFASLGWRKTMVEMTRELP